MREGEHQVISGENGRASQVGTALHEALIDKEALQGVRYFPS